VNGTVQPEKQKIQKIQPKKKSYGAMMNSAQVKSQSSEKAQKSESLENLFSKKAEHTLPKKTNQLQHQ
jgi:hypothetical protein